MAPAVPPAVIFDLQNVHTALSAPVPDQEALVNIIGRREYQQLVNLARHYKATYSVDLSAELNRRIIGSVGSLLAGACQHKILAQVHYLHRAGKSNRKYEALRKKDTAVEILVGRTPEDLRELREAFTAVHNADIQAHVLSYLKDDLTKTFFIDILKDKEDKPVENVGAEIERLHQLLQAQEIPALLKYVSSLTTAQLHTVVKSYNAHYMDAHVVTTIEKNFKHKGEHIDIILFTIMQAADPARHVSLLFEESMSGLGTNEDQLSRLVVVNRGKFMDKVKATYQMDYSRTLADRVRGDTSGLYSNLICHMINQTI
ncbi:hypothetical protein BGZ54_006402 [Gamsiella multidivaricata]|nr:hypothetical protein BGZ54_006402 [Gamsiella multidivaricata]